MLGSWLVLTEVLNSLSDLAYRAPSNMVFDLKMNVLLCGYNVFAVQQNSL